MTLSGDFGTSISTGRPVAEEVALAPSATRSILAIGAHLLSFSLAIVLGTPAAYAKTRVVDRLVTSIALVGVSVPHFWLAIVLVIIFSVELGMLPPMGIGPENATGWRLDGPHLAHMVLPTIALSRHPARRHDPHRPLDGEGGAQHGVRDGHAGQGPAAPARSCSMS